MENERKQGQKTCSLVQDARMMGSLAGDISTVLGVSHLCTTTERRKVWGRFGDDGAVSLLKLTADSRTVEDMGAN